MHSGKNLCDTSTGGVTPNHDVLKTKLLGQTFDVLDIILDQIGPLRIPVRISMATHVNG
jgi:hypothetical protein